MTYDLNWAFQVLAKTGTPDDQIIQQVQELRAASGMALSTNEARDLAKKVRGLPRAESVLLIDDHGSPVGVVSPKNIIEEGSRFAFELASVCDDKAALVRVQQQTLERVGTDSFGYVAASALTFMAETILAGAFAVCKAHGSDLQPDMAAFARGENPDGA